LRYSLANYVAKWIGLTVKLLGYLAAGYFGIRILLNKIEPEPSDEKMLLAAGCVRVLGQVLKHENHESQKYTKSVSFRAFILISLTYTLSI